MGDAIVPLLIVDKRMLKAFNARFDDGRSMPIATMHQNIDSARQLLGYAYQEALGTNYNPQLAQVFHEIVGPSAEAVSIARALIQTGIYRSQQLLSQEDLETLQNTSDIKELTQDLAKGFLLCGILRFEDLGKRQVIKISYAWELKGLSGWIPTLFGRQRLHLPTVASADTGSYHLEFAIPDECVCRALSIQPAENGPEMQRNEEWKPSGAVAHVQASYLRPPDPGVDAHAWLELSHRRDGTWWTAHLSVAICVLLSWIFRRSELADPTQAVTLLVAIPALVIGAIATRTSHKVLQPLVRPYRVATVTASILLFVLAISQLSLWDSTTTERLVTVIWILGVVLGGILLTRELLPVVLRQGAYFVGWFLYPEDTSESLWRWRT